MTVSKEINEIKYTTLFLILTIIFYYDILTCIISQLKLQLRIKLTINLISSRD